MTERRRTYFREYYQTHKAQIKANSARQRERQWREEHNLEKETDEMENRKKDGQFVKGHRLGGRKPKVEKKRPLVFYVSHPVTGWDKKMMKEDIGDIVKALKKKYKGCKVVTPEDCVSVKSQGGASMNGTTANVTNKPAVTDEVGDDYWCWCMGMCLGRMLMCDAVCFHWGWSQSRGCGIEMQLAVKMRKGIVRAESVKSLHGVREIDLWELSDMTRREEVEAMFRREEEARMAVRKKMDEEGETEFTVTADW